MTGSRHLPSRREILQWAAALSAASMVPGCSSGDQSITNGPGPTPVPPKFLTAEEFIAVGVLADVVVPPGDGVPGGRELGTAHFVDKLLSTFDDPSSPPYLFASGPYSDRQQIPNSDGSLSGTFSTNNYAIAQPLDRVNAAAWKLYLFGSDAVGGGPNDAVLGKVIGLRDQFKSVLATAINAAGKPMEQLNVAEQVQVYNQLPADFQSTLVELTCHACWGAPEYGGNLNGVGWAIVNYEGDILPLGYTRYDATTNSLLELPNHPVSTANPGPDPFPLDDEVRALLATVVEALGGTVNS